MKIALIQIDLLMGARVLIRVLQERGYEVKSLQLNMRYTDSLTEHDMEIIYNYVADAEVVGLSFTTIYALIAEQLGQFLKKKGIKFIIAGGSHATALPEDVIRYSDIVAIYEAEITLPQIIKCLDNTNELSQIKGIVYKDKDNIVHNTGAPEIIWELDMLPFPSVDTQIIKYFDPKNKIYTPKKAKLFSGVDNRYLILASRGCPFSCTYCSNNLYHALDKSFKKVRKRSIENVIAEMEYAMQNGFESFAIEDDHFFCFTLEEIKLFAFKYNKTIKKPFSVGGINPIDFISSSAEQKLKLLLDCGLTDMRIGIQSGNNKTLKVFKRGYKAEDLTKILAPIDRNRKTIWDSPYDRLHVGLDFICDAPWETVEDKIATIKLAQNILSQYSIYSYTLVFLPGTEIYSLALSNKWIDDRVKDIYLKGIAGIDDTIYNRLLFLIAITKERGITVQKNIMGHILKLADSNQDDIAKEIIDSIIECINQTEKHHNVNLKHAAVYPYLSGYIEWTKKVGDTGRKVLFRSYHEPYG